MAPRADATLAAGLAFVLVSFALNSVMTRVLVAGPLLDPALATVLRFLAGAAALAVLLAARGRLGAARPGKGNLQPAFWLGAYAFLISYGYVHIGAAAGTFAFYACVLATMTVGGAWTERRRPPTRALAGGLVALAGVGALALGRGGDATPLGVALLAGTGVAWGAYSVHARRRSEALPYTAANFLALALVLAPAGAIAASGAAGVPAFTWAGAALAVFMGAVTTALSYAVWYWALARIGRAQAGTAQLAIPVLAGILGVGLLGEPLTPALLVAGALVLAGMALAGLREAPPLSPAAPSSAPGRP